MNLEALTDEPLQGASCLTAAGPHGRLLSHCALWCSGKAQTMPLQPHWPCTSGKTHTFVEQGTFGTRSILLG